MSRIERVEVVQFAYETPNLGTTGDKGVGVANIGYVDGGRLSVTRYAVRITTDDGAAGEHVCRGVGTPASMGQTLMLAPQIVGRDPDERELIYDDLKRELRAYDHMGHGPIDIALWDLLGKRLNTSVSTLLGGFRDRIPVYASTYHGQESGGGLETPKHFAAFAIDCVERGFTGFKIHGWNTGDVKREIQCVLAVREAVGPDVAIMVDPACELRTWSDALKLGLACDEANCLWYEDPYRDSGNASVGHQRLRDKIRTPLLMAEYVRSPEVKAEWILSGACDMVHIDPEYDLGITGAMKIAHFCELLGLDVQVHAPGPAHRAIISAIRNTSFYELALVGPDMPNFVSPPWTTDGYGDQLDDVGPDGCIPVLRGPGLGVTYDWEWIESRVTARHVFD
jgi:L-alanine-DL-glutamate epimerase-like enolase superfamily enzyme